MVTRVGNHQNRKPRSAAVARWAIMLLAAVIVLSTLYVAVIRPVTLDSALLLDNAPLPPLNKKMREEAATTAPTSIQIVPLQQPSPPRASASIGVSLPLRKVRPDINGVILFLSGGRWDSYFLRECLPRLERYFLACHAYPVRIFHENLPRPQKKAISDKIPSAWEVVFEDVASIWKALPSAVSEQQLIEWMNTGVQKKFQGRGYRIMCRFWAGLVWRLPSMQQYDYYWRLDTDSILTQPPRVDPFVIMRDRRCDYGFNRLKGENPYVAMHLWETFVQWKQQKQQEEGQQKKEDDGSVARWFAKVESFAVDPKTRQYWAPMYYNNFELGSMRLKRHPLYDSWFEFVDSQPPYGILQYRWGDAPLHTLGVHAVLAAEGWTACNFTKADVGYRHAAEKPGPILPLNCTA